MNHVVLCGNLARDPDVRYTSTGMPVCNGAVCVSRKFKRGEELVEETLFVEFAVWGSRGEAFAKFHRKGQRALLQGHLQEDSWKDKVTGQERKRIKLVVDEWEFASSRSEEAPRDAGEPQPRPAADDTPF